MGTKLRNAAVVNAFAGLALVVAAITTSLVVCWAFAVIEFLLVIGCFAMLRSPSR